MANTFDPATIEAIRTEMEVRIRPGDSTKRGVIIWAVVADGAVFVRSVQGPEGKWFKALSAARHGALEVGGQALPVTATPVVDKRTLDAVSAEYLRKYATSPYAKSMVRDEVLPTTLRLEPR